MEELALLTKHSRKTNARATFPQVVFATEKKIIGRGKKGYTCTESYREHSVAKQGPPVLVEISKEQWSG